MKRIIASLILSLCSTVAFGASCSVSEFTALPTDSAGRVIEVPMLKSGGNTTQVDTSITTAEALGSAFATTTRYVWIYCDELVHVIVGLAPASILTVSTGVRIPSGGFWVGLPKEDVALGTLIMALCDTDCS